MPSDAERTDEDIIAEMTRKIMRPDPPLSTRYAPRQDSISGLWKVIDTTIGWSVSGPHAEERYAVGAAKTLNVRAAREEA